MRTAGTGGHEFPCVDGIVDLLPNLSDKHLLEESAHFDSIAKAERMSILPQAYFFKKMVIDYKRVIYEFIEKGCRITEKERVSQLVK